MNIGCHVSLAKGIDSAPKEASDLGCEAMQFFTRSPHGGPVPEIAEETAKSFKANCKKFKIKNSYVHAPYLINFASSNNRVYYGSISSIKTELARASLLGVKYVMTHLGSAKDLGEKESLEKTIEGLKKVFDGYTGKAKLLIENSAGAGQIIGSDFKQVSKTLSAMSGVAVMAGACLDTQHSFASGYDWKNKFDESLQKIDKSLGLENIKLIHANDSLTELDSRVDRHAHIGKGKIGLDGFKNLVKFAEERNIDMICETNYPGVAKDVEILKDLRKKLKIKKF